MNAIFEETAQFQNILKASCRLSDVRNGFLVLPFPEKAIFHFHFRRWLWQYVQGRVEQRHFVCISG